MTEDTGAGSWEATRRVTQAELDGFAAVSGDDNPIHVDAAFAATTPFRVPVAHGMFLFALVRAELRRMLPQLSLARQHLVFPAPTPVDTDVTVRLEVGGADDGWRRVTTQVTHDGGTGLEGTAWLGERPAPPASAPGTGSPTSRATRSGDWWDRAVGRRAEVRGRFEASSLAAYGRLAGDTVPGHVPEPLVLGLVSRLLGVDLPGPGTNYLRQRTDFHRPVAPDEELVAAVEVVRVRPDKRLVDLRTTCDDADGVRVCTGEALVLARGVIAPGRG